MAIPSAFDDQIPLGRFALARAFLKDDQRFPWVVLVPDGTARDLIDLAGADRALLMEEIAATSHALRRVFAPDRVEVAMLAGGEVAGFRVDVIARFASDAAWPRPVWTADGPARAYPAHVQAGLADQLSAAMGLVGEESA
jgi:diadenosine tetraphosphate (Ap4A) HIT family hydrolase